LTTLIDVPLMFVLALRTILKIGHCYGYALDRAADRQFVLGILIAASSSSLQVKRKRLDELKQIEEMLLEETQEEILAEEALSLLFQLEIFEEVPGVGMISGALLNLFFIRRVDRTARHVFQERWLAENGRVDVIEPATVHARRVAGGLGGAFGRLTYSGLYSLGYGAALPVHFVVSLFRSTDNPMTRGTRVATT
jgi:EcsC protein family